MIQPIDPLPTQAVLGLQTDAERVAYMKSLGARNTEPPLPRSPYLRVKATGQIRIWTDILAEQPDLVECCDAHGNTDPSVWMEMMAGDLEDPTARELRIAAAQAQILGHAQRLSAGYNSANITPNTPVDVNVVTYDDIANLIAAARAR